MKLSLDAYSDIGVAISDKRRAMLLNWLEGVTDPDGKLLPAEDGRWKEYGAFWARRIQQLNDADIQFRKLRINWVEEELDVVEAS